MLLDDNLGIVKYPIRDCVVNARMHVSLGDGLCLLLFYLLGKGGYVFGSVG